MDAVRFGATMSKGLATSTIGLVVLLFLVLGGTVALMLWIGARTGWPPHLKLLNAILLPLIGLPLLAAVLLTYLYAPSGYALTEEAVVIERPLQPISIPLASLTQVRRVGPEELRGTLKTMGADGMFARIGRFHSPRLGNFRMYVRDTSNAVLLDGAGERFLVSPDEPDAFVAAVVERRRRVSPGGGG